MSKQLVSSMIQQNLVHDTNPHLCTARASWFGRVFVPSFSGLESSIYYLSRGSLINRNRCLLILREFRALAAVLAMGFKC